MKKNLRALFNRQSLLSLKNASITGLFLCTTLGYAVTRDFEQAAALGLICTALGAVFHFVDQMDPENKGTPNKDDDTDPFGGGWDDNGNKPPPPTGPKGGRPFLDMPSDQRKTQQEALQRVASTPIKTKTYDPA